MTLRLDEPKFQKRLKMSQAQCSQLIQLGSNQASGKFSRARSSLGSNTWAQSRAKKSDSFHLYLGLIWLMLRTIPHLMCVLILQRPFLNSDSNQELFCDHFLSKNSPRPVVQRLRRNFDSNSLNFFSNFSVLEEPRCEPEATEWEARMLSIVLCPSPQRFTKTLNF